MDTRTRRVNTAPKTVSESTRPVKRTWLGSRAMATAAIMPLREEPRTTARRHVRTAVAVLATAFRRNAPAGLGPSRR
jgi:hypothetical protein